MIDQLEAIKIVPVVAINSVDHAAPLADALCEGGLPCAEITLRTEAGLKAMQQMAQRSDILVGAGTVHSVDQAKASVDAGAKFIVTPGFNPKTVGWCVDQGVPIFPGCSSPTDLESALEFGLKIVKFFPAEVLGGVKTLKAFAGPYGGIRFIPTGGISAGNLPDYLALPSVVACGGSWMVKGALMDEGKFQEISNLASEAVKLARGTNAG